MGGRGGSLRGSQGMNAPTAIVRTVSKTPTPTAAAVAAAAPAAAAPAAAQAAPAKAQAKKQVSTPPTGANGFAHLTPAQVSALEGAAKQAMRNDPALAAGIQDYTNPRQTANGKAFSQNANWAPGHGQPQADQAGTGHDGRPGQAGKARGHRDHALPRRPRRFPAAAQSGQRPAHDQRTAPAGTGR